jgi:sulfur carrier protein
MTTMQPNNTVLLNGKPIQHAEGLTLAELLTKLREPEDQVATALNGQFIARPQREHTPLQPGDQVTVFKAIVGG